MNKYIKYVIESFFDDIEDDLNNNIASSMHKLYKNEIGIISTNNEVVLNDKKYKTIPHELTYIDIGYPSSLSNFFYFDNSICSINFNNYDTSHLTDITELFNDCILLNHVHFGNFDTSHITNTSSMFFECHSLKSIDLHTCNLTNVTDMHNMFTACYALTYIRFNTDIINKITNMAGMFQNCSSIISLDLSMFDTSNVTDMSYLFCNCTSLESLDLSNFNISNVTHMRYMFYKCYKLKNIKCTKEFKQWCIDNQFKVTLIGSTVIEEINWEIIN